MPSRVPVVFALLLTLTMSAAAQRPYFPDRFDWQRRAPEDVGLDAAALAEADATADHAAAIEMLRRGLAHDISHRMLREQLGVRKRALERQEAEQRRAAEIAAALAAAGRAPSDEAAIGILEAVLPLELEVRRR